MTINSYVFHQGVMRWWSPQGMMEWNLKILFEQRHDNCDGIQRFHLNPLVE